MKFKTGMKGKTRDGRDYRVICDDRKSNNSDYTVIALIKSESGIETSREYTYYGRYMVAEPDGLDLLPPTKRVYVNVSLSAVTKNHVNGFYYATPEEAQERATNNAIAIALPLDIPCDD